MSAWAEAPPIRHVPWLTVATVLALVLAAVQLGARIGPIVTSAANYEGELLLSWLLALLAWPTALVLAVAAILAIVRGRCHAAVPLVAALGALAVPFLPLGGALRDLDDALHRAARGEIVRRV